jgi:tetratricopeptide (TPR) repeat protein
MTPRVLKIILVVAFNAWWCCALSLLAPPLVLAQSTPPLPDDLRIESPATDLPPAIKEFSGAWEGTWRMNAIGPGGSLRFEKARLKVILVVEKVWDQGATVVFAGGDCPGFRDSKKWGRYQARISSDDGRVGLTFAAANGRDYTFSINNRGHLEAIDIMGWGRFLDIELTRREAVPAGGKVLASKSPKSKAAALKKETAHEQQALTLARWEQYDRSPAPGSETGKSQDWKMRRASPIYIWNKKGYRDSPWGLTAETLYFRGYDLLSRNQLDKAIVAFTQALAKNPKFGEAYINRGLAYGKKGQYDQAIADFNKFIELDSRDSEAYYNRGVAYAKKGWYGQALADFNQALKLNPRDTQAARMRDLIASGNRLASKTAESKAAAEKEEAAHKKQALTLARNAKYDQALAEINQALTQDPKDAETYNRRGGIYTLQGHYAQAVADFDKAIELNPKYAKAYYNRALAYYYQGKYDQAINDLTKAIELKPKDVASYNNRGLAYMQKGNYERAIDDFNVATILNPKLADAYYNKAVSCGKVGRRDEAREAYAAFVKLAPPAAKDQIEQAQDKLSNP